MANSKVSNAVVKWKIADLKQHPRQAEIFTDPSDDQLHKFTIDIQTNGLQTPIEILPDGTIICGHQRVQVAKRLGWAEIDAIVRSDLASQGKAAVEERMITDNLNRRQLDPLDVARCYRALRKLAPKLPTQKRHLYQHADQRDILAKMFNMSGRNLDRRDRVLDTPMAVQKAVSANRLTIKAAGKVAGLGEKVQQQIAKRIEAGEDPETVVASFVPKGDGRHKKVGDAKASFIRTLSHGLADLEGRIDQIKTLKIEDKTVLVKGKETIEKILQQAKVLDPAKKEAEDLAKAKEIRELMKKSARR